MIDFIQSKMAILVAVLIITATMIGVFNWQKSNTENLSLNSVSNNITTLINEVSTTDGEIKKLVTFNESKKYEADYFPSRIGGETYKIRLSRGGIILDQGKNSVSMDFSSSVHVWNPGNMKNATSSELRRADDKIPVLKFKSVYDFYIESTYLDGSGHECFVYLAESDKFQKNTVNRLGEKINEFYKIKKSVENQDEINKEKKFDQSVFKESFTVYKNLMVFNKTKTRGYDSCYIINADHLWDPDEINEPIKYEEIEEKDKSVNSLVIKNTFTLCRRNIEIKNGTEVKSVIQNFIFVQ